MTDKNQYDPPTTDEVQELGRLRRLFGTYLLLILMLPTIAIVILLYIMWSLSQEVDNVKALEQISRIETQYRQSKNYMFAITALRDLAQQSGHPQAYARWAEIAAGVGKDEMARQAFDEASKVSNPSWELYSTLCYVELASGNESLAVEFGERALRDNSLDVNTLNNLAWIYATTSNESLKDFNKAEEYAEKAVLYTLAENKNILDTLKFIYSKTASREVFEEKASNAFNGMIRDRVIQYLKDVTNSASE